MDTHASSSANNQIPFNTQFFHDDYDDGGGFEEDFVDGELAAGVGEQEEADLAAAAQGQVKRTRAEFVNYARKAKRVDVKKLKENIWKSLEIVVDHDDDDEMVSLSAGYSFVGRLESNT